MCRTQEHFGISTAEAVKLAAAPGLRQLLGLSAWHGLGSADGVQRGGDTPGKDVSPTAVSLHVVDAAVGERSSSHPSPTTDPATLHADLDAYGYCLMADALACEADAEALRSALATDSLVTQPAVAAALMHPGVAALIVGLLGSHHLLSAVSRELEPVGGNAATLQWFMPQPIARAALHPSVRPGSFTPGGAPPSATSGYIAPAVTAACLWCPDGLGPTSLVVPKSHLSGRQPGCAGADLAAAVPLEAPAGCCVVLDGRLWHMAVAGVQGGGTVALPGGLRACWCGPQFRQAEAFARSIPREEAARLPPDLRRVLGMGTWHSYGGCPGEQYHGLFSDRWLRGNDGNGLTCGASL
eukprot:SAG22_NODE_2406_length_2606_cov_1.556841_2_plen_354_part_00